MIKKNILVGLLVPGLVLSVIIPQNIHKIGQLIWQNESGRRVDLLVFWNEHESFPSFGVGHNIWFPATFNANFTQSFPLLCAYLKSHGVKLPEWLENALPGPAPWLTRADFLKDTQRTKELQRILESTIDLQVNFMIDQLEQLWPKMIHMAPAAQRKKIIHNFRLMRSSLLGTYALVDYLNFKGSGLNAHTTGENWGLLQVLLGMPHGLTQDNVNQAFTVSAAKVLIKLIEQSAPKYNRVKFLKGWMIRLSTYSDPASLDR